MKLRSLLLLVFCCLLNQAFAQQKKISLEEIWNGTFNTEKLEVLRSMQNGREYTVLNTNPAKGLSSIEAYDYLTQEKTRTLLASGGSGAIPYFTSYEFSRDESRILLATEEESLFRRSTRGIYYVYDLKGGNLTPISVEKIREPRFSPNGRQVAYVLENNIYVFDLSSKTTRQLTFDGEINKIINGVADWVYEEEFSLVRAFEWNEEGDRIAFLRFDESEVPEFSMEIYGQGLYPLQNRFKYPKAGEDNAFVSLHLYDLESKETRRVPLPLDYYIPRIQWMNTPGQLSVMALNRHQNRLHLYKVDAQTAVASLLLEETDSTWLDITQHHFLDFLPDDRFLWTSEADGFNHLYLYDKNGSLIRQLTSGPWEVTAVYGYDPEKDRVYYQSTETGSINRDLYSISTGGGKKRQLSTREGTHSAEFSADYTYYIDTFSNSSTPPAFTLHKSHTGELIRIIKDNAALLRRLNAYELSPKEYSEIEINGQVLNMWMVKPQEFDPAVAYPLLMFQYSGPGSQKVANTWLDSNDYWHQVLASRGYIVSCVDGRGTGYKGRDFEKLTYRELGKYEVEDQITAATRLSELPYIDSGRTGIWGWSYGGFMAANCLLQGNDTFELGIAVAPVTSWRFYDTIYTERYMRTPGENQEGYDNNSPLSHAGRLKGDFLLVHGSADDNVHVQNTMRLIDALVRENKQFDWAIYPDQNHSIAGGNTRLHLYTLMTNFLTEHL